MAQIVGVNMQNNRNFIDNWIMCCDRTIDSVYNLCLESDITTIDDFITYFKDKQIKGISPITNAQTQGMAELYYFEKYSIPSETIVDILDKTIDFDQTKHLNYVRFLRRLGFNSTQTKIIEYQLKQEKNKTPEELNCLTIMKLLSNLKQNIKRNNIITRSTKAKIAVLEKMYTYKPQIIKYQPRNGESIAAVRERIENFVFKITEYYIRSEELKKIGESTSEFSIKKAR